LKNVKSIYPLLFILLFLASCGPQYISKSNAFPKMYEEHPLSILVLPPINETTAADAKEYYSTTIAEPLTYAGYYVYPIEVTSDLLKAEGLGDTEMLVGLPPQKFRGYFGADAVLYIKILKWDTSYFVLGANITVSVQFILRSTITGETLWEYYDTVVQDTSGDSGNSNAGLAGLLVKVVATAITTATTDYVPIARQLNQRALVSIPYGKYHPSFGQDKDIEILEKKLPEQPKK